MKIALVFSGLARELVRSSPSIRQKLIQNYDVDVYSIVWNTHEFDRLPLAYNHKLIDGHHPLDFSPCGETKFSIHPHMYGIQRACRVFREYTEKHNLKYDFVIRTRHDITVHNFIQFEKLDPNILYQANCHWPGWGYFDDNFLICNQQKYYEIYEHLHDWYLSKHTVNTYDDIPEARWTDYLNETNNSLRVLRHNMFDFSVTRFLTT